MWTLRDSFHKHLLPDDKSKVLFKYLTYGVAHQTAKPPAFRDLIMATDK